METLCVWGMIGIEPMQSGPYRTGHCFCLLPTTLRGQFSFVNECYSGKYNTIQKKSIHKSCERLIWSTCHILHLTAFISFVICQYSLPFLSRNPWPQCPSTLLDQNRHVLSQLFMVNYLNKPFRITTV